jgi:hypothetical protein
MSSMNDLGNLMRDTLDAAAADYKHDLQILPHVKVMKMGGQSITDRGRKAVFPILDEIVENKDKHQIIITSGGGTRARHSYQVGIDLNMPVGVLAEMGGAITVQNARMLQMVMAKHGGIFLDHLEFEKLRLCLVCRHIVFGKIFQIQDPFLCTEQIVVLSSLLRRWEQILFISSKMKKDCIQTIPRKIQMLHLFRVYMWTN